MQKAGGIIAIIAGIFGLFAAGATLLIGGLGSAFEANDAGTVIGLGWGGVVFSFLVIILGAIAISAETKKIGTLLIVSSIGGAVLGGTLVALFMVLSLIGGILATVSTKAPGNKQDKAGDGSSEAPPRADLRRTSRSAAMDKEEVPVRTTSVGDAGTLDSGMKLCPFCAEEIKVEARKCKHCGSALEPVAGSSNALTRDKAEGRVEEAVDTRHGDAKRWIVVGAVMALVVVVAVAAWALVGRNASEPKAGVGATGADDAAAATGQPPQAMEQLYADDEASQAAVTETELQRQAAIDAYSQALQAEQQANAIAEPGNCEDGASNMAGVIACEFAKTEAAVDGAELELRAALSRGGFSEQLIALRQSQEEWKNSRDTDCQQVYDEASTESGGYAEGSRLECIQGHNEGRVEELRAYAEICGNGDRSACVVE